MKTIIENWTLEVYLVFVLILVGVGAIVYRNFLDICYFVVVSLITIRYFIDSRKEK